MNILVFAHDASLYGASQSLLTTLEGINKKGNNNLLVLLPYPGKMEQALDKAKINYKVVYYPRCVADSNASQLIFKKLINISLHFKKLSWILPQLKKIAIDFDADVIYTNTSVVDAGYKVAKGLKIPHVWHVREFGLKVYGLTYYPSWRNISRKIQRSTSSIFGSELLKKRWIKKDDIKYSVIYTGVNDEITFSNFLPRSFPIQKLRIGILGAVLPGKGQDIAIKAFAEFIKIKPNSILSIYGDICDLKYHTLLQNLIQKLQIQENIFFHTFLDDKDKIYKELDVLLNCSKMEGFGRTIVEAMGRGIPVIGNASGGILEIIDDKINGLLFDGTPQNLASLMISLLKENNSLYESISVNAFRKARENYTIPAYVDAVDSVLQIAVESYLKN